MNYGSWHTFGETMVTALSAAACAALIFVAILLLKSLTNISYGGPQIITVLARHYKAYVSFAIGRLALAVWLLCNVLAWPGVALYLVAYSGATLDSTHHGAAIIAGFLSILVCVAFQFLSCLLREPGVIAANASFRVSRIYPLWDALTPQRLSALWWFAWCAFFGCMLWASMGWFGNDRGGHFAGAWLLAIAFALAMLVAHYRARVPTIHEQAQRSTSRKRNIVLIGCDTLRADRVVPEQHERVLTPHIHRLNERGLFFENCYVPIARTAPSLISLLTGCWPHKHGIRENFSTSTAMSRDIEAIPRILGRAGYQTAAISDWAGSDLGKFDLGFQHKDLPDDQWNIKYVIRQGPKDLRLFLALFTHNWIGKKLLPEIYYVAGRPLAKDLSIRTLQQIDSFSENDQPFFVNVFMSTGHPPFSVEYPYYTLYADSNYRGESKFAMSKLTDPQEIIRSQREPREAFDLDQITDLYDGCVKRFDDAVGEIVAHLEQRKLLDSTIVVVYSDHGMDFFEHGTWGQGNSAFGDFSARVPLTVTLPDGDSPERFTRPVRSIDLAPTLLNLVGESVPAWMDGKPLLEASSPAARASTVYFETGIWLAPPPDGAPGHIRYPDALYILDVQANDCGSFIVRPSFEKLVVDARDRLVRRDNWVLIYQPTEEGPVYALYDVANDPNYHHDVSEKHPQITQELQREMASFLAFD